MRPLSSSADRALRRPGQGIGQADVGGRGVGLDPLQLRHRRIDAAVHDLHQGERDPGPALRRIDVGDIAIGGFGGLEAAAAHIGVGEQQAVAGVTR